MPEKKIGFQKNRLPPEEQLNHDDALLFFEGLEHACDVFLNGSRIPITKHVCRPKISVKNSSQGKITLHPIFFAITRSCRSSYSRFDYPGIRARSPNLAFTAGKAPYQFGWDWGMRLVQMGIWKPITLTFYDKARIDDFFVKQTSVTKEKAIIDNQLEIYSGKPQPSMHALPLNMVKR
jgi:beta-mannosidase